MGEESQEPSLFAFAYITCKDHLNYGLHLQIIKSRAVTLLRLQLFSGIGNQLLNLMPILRLAALTFLMLSLFPFALVLVLLLSALSHVRSPRVSH